MAYRVNEIFYSLQGEGLRAGTPNVFVRFAGCNLACSREAEGFDCDTDFSGGRPFEADALLAEVRRIGGDCKAVIFTGGEPALQLDPILVAAFKEAGYYLAIETNGTRYLPAGLDWITVSPKTANHTIKALKADEVKYVLHDGQALPRPILEAGHYLLSPAFESDGALSLANLRWCVELVKLNPTWRLSVQQHKIWRVR